MSLPFVLPRRLRGQAGSHALVDGIAFDLPVNSVDSPALMAAFSVDAGAAQALLPGRELHALRLPNGRGVLLITVIDYRTTDIGAYVEFSVAIGCTHGARPWPLPAAALCMQRSGLGQYVWDLPVSSRISVKGGKGVWGMPKHQANLDFRVEDRTMSSQYDLDGELCLRITVDRPQGWKVPLRNVGAVNWCQFRGMLMKSSIYFSDDAEVAFGRKASAQLLIGSHPRMDPLRELDVSSRAFFTATMPHSHGVLDDHFEGWFLTGDTPAEALEPAPAGGSEGLESVVGLDNDTSWLDPPSAAGRRQAAEVPR
jgi:hypothetical protein